MQPHRGAGPPNAAAQRAVGMNLDGASDRPSGGSQRGSAAGSPSRPRSGSTTGSPSRSRSGSTSVNPPTSAGPGPFHRGTGKDPAFDSRDRRSSRPALSQAQLIGKLVDLPAEAYKKDLDTPFARRPGFNSVGKVVQTQLNIFPVSQIPRCDIYQYAVNVSPNPRDSAALVKKVWNSRKWQNWLQNTGSKWLYDGSKLAWCTKRIDRDEARLAVDLDQEADKKGQNGVFYISITKTAVIRMEMLKAYIAKKASWDDHILACMNFMDHLMRQYPSEHMRTIKRNFYPADGKWIELDEMVHVRKGTYSAFRFGETGSGSVSRGLNLNVDVANTAFWAENLTVAQVAQWLCSSVKNRNYERAMPFGRLADLLRPVKRHDKNGNIFWDKSEDFKKLRRLQRLKFYPTHLPVKAGEKPKVHTIDAIIFDQSFGEKGADAFHVSFIKKERGESEGKKITIDQYWREKYHRLKCPDLPIISTKKGGFYPMEVCKLMDFQRYAYKLDPEQTSAMIKIAVSRPRQRKAEIMQGVENLAWDKDPYFKEYGVEVGKQMLVTNARVLENPELVFAGGARLDPKLGGRWDLRGKRFFEPNRVHLDSWAFIGVGSNDKSAIQLEELKKFADNFCRIYRGHGGIIQVSPLVKVYPYQMGYPNMCTAAFTDTGNHFKKTPRMLFFVLSTRNQLVYERLKKNMECRLCMVTQMMQADHVKKNNDQYCSNVAMKVNAKLGGVTAKAVPAKAQSNHSYTKCDTMILGMDVTHSGGDQSRMPSIAALTMSIDKNALRYTGAVQTNGFNTEIVQSHVMHDMFPKQLALWVRTNKAIPAHVYYFRDGVSEGQFSQVLDFEVKDLKRAFQEANLTIPRFTVIVATKRHRIRFFPKPGEKGAADKNDNPVPGLLVEHDATHMFHWDFFLASHVAIQGTARPVHYHVLLDEAGCNPNDLQKMIYHQCYQYVRSTTPVSLHPAVYYSHLAAARGRAHEDQAASEREIPSGKAGFPLAIQRTTTSGARPTEAPLLLPMQRDGADAKNMMVLNESMWYI